MYLVEGQMGYGTEGEPQRTVGPKCAEVMNPTDKGPCDIKQFLKYIWAPRVYVEEKEGQSLRTVYRDAEGMEYLDSEDKPLTLQQIKDTKRPEGDVKLKNGLS